ncbi:putative polysaccharide pyruvyl transferase [Indibacter alkaliphilus LW1]|uniref:Polysaccharide pyruvyl transferase n=1 Tax=Indibacter alkaliphilus (strain CCUG 57479 / KCTC 22604 / LW1) TaxID=1189612 RepID=S2D3H1_INDAL|nr:polysaccharide pyruvyl transferase family protein [Indibacter alkaliphilus]EOZ93862.1 putative polysaccharide pyruvyl transferase [Indibacter alkaliphilus LW1]
MLNSDILFNGYYGQKNTGDDAFVEVTSWAANTIWRKKNIKYLAIKKNLPQTTYKIRGYPFSFPKSYSFQQTILINQTKAFISAGGSVFHSELQVTNPKYYALQKKLKDNNFKIGAIGVSIGPFKSKVAEKSITEYLKKLDFLTVRDKSSYEYVKSLDLSCKPVESFDMAALLPSIYVIEKYKNYKKTIGISLCYSERFTKGNIQNEIKRIKRLSELIQQLDKNDNLHFKFIVINGNQRNGDRELTLKTIKEANFKNTFEVVEYNSETKVMWQSIASCDFMLSTRLHGAIFACFAQTPFMLVEYHKKCSDFLEDVGYNENLRVFDMETDIEKTSNRILTIMNNFDCYDAPLFIEEMKNKALLNFSTVDL